MKLETFINFNFDSFMNVIQNGVYNFLKKEYSVQRSKNEIYVHILGGDTELTTIEFILKDDFSAINMNISGQVNYKDVYFLRNDTVEIIADIIRVFSNSLKYNKTSSVDFSKNYDIAEELSNEFSKINGVSSCGISDGFNEHDSSMMFTFMIDLKVIEKESSGKTRPYNVPAKFSKDLNFYKKEITEIITKNNKDKVKLEIVSKIYLPKLKSWIDKEFNEKHDYYDGDVISFEVEISLN